MDLNENLIAEFLSADDLDVRQQDLKASLLHMVQIFAGPLGGASEGHVVINNLLGHTALLVNQIDRYRFKPLGLLAWVARSLLEANLWLRYVLIDDAHMIRFGAAQIPDVRAVFSNLDEGAKNCLGDDFMSTFAPNAKEAKEILKENSDFSKLLEFPNVAHEVDQKKEYDAYYTLFSKLIHSTPWVLSGLSKKHNIQALRRCLMTKSLEYAEANRDLIRSRLKKALERISD